MAQSRGEISRIAIEVYHRETDRKPEERYNLAMDFVIHWIARVVVPLFFVGMAGSAVVIAVSFVEDLKELFGDED